MHATRRRVGSCPGLADAANVLTTAIRADGRHDHVSVRTERGFLYVDVDEEPIVRLEPLSGDQYGLSFHHHTGVGSLRPSLVMSMSAASHVSS